MKTLNLRLFDTMQGQQLMQTDQQEQPYVSPVNEQFVDKLIRMLKSYTEGKKNLESKIIENDKWFRSLHWDIVRGKAKRNDEPEPVTAYLFNAIANKHADAMDYYPEPNIFEREEDDLQEAETLTKVIPLVIEQNKFKKTYSNCWWYKLKQGCSVYGVFWNPELENGLGNIDIQKVDMLNCYWKPGIVDIQKSPYFFIVSLMDNDEINLMYPEETNGKLSGYKPLDIKTYFNADTINTTNSSIIVDAYYKKKNSQGKTVLHLTKFVDNIVLASTEDDPDYAESGLYDHGMFPVLFDPLFPEEDSPVGFGYIDIIKNPQMYIDKLDQIISKNALIAGKYRTMIKESGAVNEDELADLSKDIIHTQGQCQEGVDFALIQGKPLPPFIVNHRQDKIQELKEISGNRDFQQGGTSGGVTAYGAIVALQEAGNKLSRDMIGDSYEVYSQLIYMCIELIRQFYDAPRMFRIMDNGNSRYLKYDNSRLQPQQLPPSYDNEGMIQDPNSPNGEMVSDPEYQPQYRNPMFDIDVKPEKQSPFSREAQNQMATQLFGQGFFNPEMAVSSKIALEMMSFEGKDKIYKLISANGDLYAQLQQLQQQNAQLTQNIMGMNNLLKQKTGIDLTAPQGSNAAQGGQPVQQVGQVNNNGGM